MTPAWLEPIAVALRPALVAGGIVACCAAIGFAALPSAIRPKSARLSVPLSLSVGVTLSGLTIWVAGVLFTSRAALGILCGLAALSAVRLKPALRAVRRFLRLALRLVRANPLPSLATAVLLALTVPNVLLPLVDSDGSRYHVALPKLFLITGHVSAHLYDLPSFFPQTAEMLTMAGLQAARPEVAKFLHFAFFLASVLVLGVTVARKRPTRAAAGIAMLWFVATPVAVAEASYAFVDHIALFHLAVAALLATSGSAPLVVGLALAGAAATKYTAGPAVLAILAATVLARPRRQRLRALAAGVLPIVVALLPFALRNAIATGDPFFPMTMSILGRPVPGLNSGAVPYTADFHATAPGLLGITWDPHQGAVEADEVAGAHNLLGFAAALVAVPVPAARVLLAPVLVYAAVGVFLHPPTRYLLPMLWCLAGLGGLAAVRWLRRWAVWLALIAAMPAWMYSARLLSTDFDPWSYLSGRSSRSAVIRRWVPGSAAAALVNGLPPGGRVMTVGFPAPAYLDRAWIGEGVLNEPPLAAWLRDAGSSSAVLARFHEADIRYLIVGPRYGGGTRDSLLPLATTPGARALVVALRRSLRHVATLDGFDVYDVAASDSPPEPSATGTN